MTTAPPGGWPAGYVFRVGGHLDPHWAASFGMVLVHDPDGTTTLTGAVTDQAELHGTLARIRDLGVLLISVAASPRSLDADASRSLVAPTGSTDAL